MEYALFYNFNYNPIRSFLDLTRYRIRTDSGIPMPVIRFIMAHFTITSTY